MGFGVAATKRAPKKKQKHTITFNPKHPADGPRGGKGYNDFAKAKPPEPISVSASNEEGRWSEDWVLRGLGLRGLGV